MRELGKNKEYRMPAEWAPHQGTLMIWPTRPGSWPYGGKAAQKAFCQIIANLLIHEEVWLLADSAHHEEAMRGVEKALEAASPLARLHLLDIPTDDAWARDTGPTIVYDQKGARFGIDWAFNAWGGEVDGLYASWEKDDAVAAAFCARLGLPTLDAHPFVLEGGSIHTDGEGTLLVTESCLLSAGRNPAMTKEEIEATLCGYLGCEKVLWLPRGIYNDETNEHVDNVCAFVGPGEVVLAWTEDETDPQYLFSKACLEVLENSTDAKGRKIKVHKLPIPATPICVGEKDLAGFCFEAGEDVREVGERLAASYVNFYIGNGCVLLPAFGDANDEVAASILRDCFKDRQIVPIPAKDILLGGGNIHCITQQIPC